jgi:hypothetical protein
LPFRVYVPFNLKYCIWCFPDVEKWLNFFFSLPTSVTYRYRLSCYMADLPDILRGHSNNKWHRKRGSKKCQVNLLPFKSLISRLLEMKWLWLRLDFKRHIFSESKSGMECHMGGAAQKSTQNVTYDISEWSIIHSMGWKNISVNKEFFSSGNSFFLKLYVKNYFHFVDHWM